MNFSKAGLMILINESGFSLVATDPLFKIFSHAPKQKG